MQVVGSRVAHRYIARRSVLEIGLDILDHRFNINGRILN